MTITQFLHASLNVTDLQAARQFYEVGLGFQRTERNLSFPGEWYQIGPFQLHLIVAETLIRDRTNPEKWGRNRHLAFAVDDLSLVIKRLEELGYPYQASSSGRPAVFVSDPDGNLIELTQVDFIPAPSQG